MIVRQPRYTSSALIEDLASNVKDLSSSLVALEIAGSISVKGKLKSPFMFMQERVAW
jgi:hypothetical protein